MWSVSSEAGQSDLDAVHRIKDEAFTRSKVMDYLHKLADENGPRMSGSPGYTRAARYAVQAFKEAGIADAGLENWGTFGRGWSWSRISLQMHTPHATTLTAIPGDWSAGTESPVTGKVVFAPLWGERERPQATDLVEKAQQIESYKTRYRGKLKGRIVMIHHPRPFSLPEEPTAFRLDDEAIAELSQPKEPGLTDPLEWPLLRSPINAGERDRMWYRLPLEVEADQYMLHLKLNNRLAAFYREEEVAAIIATGWSRQAGVIMHSNYGSWRDEDPIPPPTAVLTGEHYNRIHRLLERDVEVELEVDIDAQFHGPGVEGHNVIAEIPGSGREDEVVMLGAHLDSWHGATGATDNAAGVAVVMEAMRILRTLDLPLQRTVRAALWEGEELNYLGSRAYVRKHFGNPVTMQLKPAHRDLSLYLNLDIGGGKIRGVYLQENDSARPVFESWFAPFTDLGVTVNTIAGTRFTDHMPFDSIGLPAFTFIQDELDYFMNTHHSNVDDVSHIIPGDLMQSAAVLAATVYQAANSPEMMPRKPLPRPLPAKKPLPEILR
jgi:hypothetical protein